MLKYLNAIVSPDEIPGETCLNINITNCPIRCPGCHAKILWQNVGEYLNKDILLKLIKDNPGITCVTFMGGDINPEDVWECGKIVKESTNLKVGWFSGNMEFPHEDYTKYFNYVKLGPYIERLGPLDCAVTNQRLYELVGTEFKDITYKYWD